MAAKRLSHCCCIPVRIGSLILAFMGIAAGISSVTFYGFWLDNDVQIFEALDEFKDQCTELYDQGRMEQEVYYKLVSALELLKESIPTILIVTIVASCITLLKNLLLAFGVLAKKRHCMLPWLVISMAVIVGNVFFGVGYSVIYATQSSLCGGALFLLIVVCMVALEYYFWQCVFSHYHELREEEFEQTREDKKMLVVEEVPPTYEEVVIVKK